MAQILSLQSITKVSKLIAALPDVQNDTRLPADPPSGNIENGQKIYSACSACHGADGAGNAQSNAPNLASQNSWYLEVQLNNFRKQTRGTDSADTYGMQMRAATLTLKSDQDVMDVLAYINSL